MQDTGIGISKDKLGLIFGSFSQADGTTTRRFGGTGLGLAISQRPANLMGGTIKAESAPGSGSRFSFDLCLEEVADPAAPAERSRELTGRRCLVVDLQRHQPADSEGSAAQMGVVAVLAEGGESALRIVADQEPRPSFDFLPVALHMPGMDGFEFIRQDNHRYPGHHSSILMLSSMDRALWVEKHDL